MLRSLPVACRRSGVRRRSDGFVLGALVPNKEVRHLPTNFKDTTHPSTRKLVGSAVRTEKDLDDRGATTPTRGGASTTAGGALKVTEDQKSTVIRRTPRTNGTVRRRRKR